MSFNVLAKSVINHSSAWEIIAYLVSGRVNFSLNKWTWKYFVKYFVEYFIIAHIIQNSPQMPQNIDILVSIFLTFPWESMLQTLFPCFLLMWGLELMTNTLKVHAFAMVQFHTSITHLTAIWNIWENFKSVPGWTFFKWSQNKYSFLHLLTKAHPKMIQAT